MSATNFPHIPACCGAGLESKLWLKSPSLPVFSLYNRQLLPAKRMMERPMNAFPSAAKKIFRQFHSFLNLDKKAALKRRVNCWLPNKWSLESGSGRCSDDSDGGSSSEQQLSPKRFLPGAAVGRWHKNSSMLGSLPFHPQFVGFR